ncbi:MAG: 16S rRNA (uracil(1498)-N(3))-methyltransferase [Elainellaceae cyanobacterium]
MPSLQRIAISTQQHRNSKLQLTVEQKHYLGRVLRLRNGDRFIALDEQDQSWVVELSGEDCATVLAAYSAPTELACRVILQTAMPKTGMEDVIRQTTELGVYGIQPIVSDRVILKPSAQKRQRWQRVAQEAAEQSERQHWPRVAEVQPFTAAIQQGAMPEAGHRGLSTAPTTAVRIICAARRSAAHLLTYIQTIPMSETIVVAVGPEGGWTAAELDLAIAAGYHPVSLGRRVLRAVTAPVAAMVLIAAACDQHNPQDAQANRSPELHD